MKALLVVVMAGALAAPAGAAAQSPLPVGERDGVRIVRERGALVVAFSKSADRLLRRVQGRMVSVFCTDFFPGGAAVGGTTMRAPSAAARSGRATLRAGWTIAGCGSRSERSGATAAASGRADA
jgi:hypothetical protein